MRLAALTEIMRGDPALQELYLVGQGYSFGQQVNRQVLALLAMERSDIDNVGDELHPLGRIQDFLPCAAKIQASGAQAVLTGNWGNDLAFLIKAVRGLGAALEFCTFYGNALGAPAAIGEAGVGAVHAVAGWHPNVGGAASTPSTPHSVGAFRIRATTVGMCACRSLSRCWLRRSRAPAVPMRRWWDMPCRARASTGERSAACTAA